VKVRGEKSVLAGTPFLFLFKPKIHTHPKSPVARRSLSLCLKDGSARDNA
jgi:hypothetical protein